MSYRTCIMCECVTVIICSLYDVSICLCDVSMSMCTLTYNYVFVQWSLLWSSLFVGRHSTPNVFLRSTCPLNRSTSRRFKTCSAVSTTSLVFFTTSVLSPIRSSTTSCLSSSVSLFAIRYFDVELVTLVIRQRCPQLTLDVASNKPTNYVDDAVFQRGASEVECPTRSSPEVILSMDAADHDLPEMEAPHEVHLTTTVFVWRRIGSRARSSQGVLLSKHQNSNISVTFDALCPATSYSLADLRFLYQGRSAAVRELGHLDWKCQSESTQRRYRHGAQIVVDQDVFSTILDHDHLLVVKWPVGELTPRPPNIVLFDQRHRPHCLRGVQATVGPATTRMRIHQSILFHRWPVYSCAVEEQYTSLIHRRVLLWMNRRRCQPLTSRNPITIVKALGPRSSSSLNMCIVGQEVVSKLIAETAFILR